MPISLALACLLAGQAAPLDTSFEKPRQLTVEGVPIEGHIGHLAPFVHDWDGDGVRDLLVGQFGGGQLAIYRNKGTHTAPVYEPQQWFQAGGETGKVPAG